MLAEKKPHRALTLVRSLFLSLSDSLLLRAGKIMEIVTAAAIAGREREPRPLSAYSRGSLKALKMDRQSQLDATSSSCMRSM